MSLTVYLNGQFMPIEQATIPVEDRAFLFADGIYEVVRVYDGRPFCMKEHMQRFVRSAHAIKLPEPDVAELEQVTRELIKVNGLSEATVYMQLTRGAYPRNHAFPAEVRPNFVAIARPFSVDESLWENGVKAITLPEQRWARCDIKSVALLPNTLAKQAAVEAGAYEAIFVRDGYAIEGSSSNFMAVLDGEIRTYPKCNYILGGITREVVLELARELGYPVREEGVRVEDLSRCTELWETSTGSEVMPIVQIDAQRVGDGRPGPVAKALRAAYLKRAGVIR